MNVSLILCCLPPLITVNYVFIYNCDLLKDPEFGASMLILDFARHRFYLLNQLINLLELN